MGVSAEILDNPEKINPLNNLANIRTGKFATAALCALASIGLLASEADARIGLYDAQAVSYDKTVTGLSKALVATCKNPPAYAPEEVQEEALECLITQAQLSSSDTPPMTFIPGLESSAELKNNDLIDCGFSHYACGKPFAAYIRQMMPEADCVGENLAWGYGPYGSMQSRFREFMASPPHRANIEKDIWDFAGIDMEREGNINYITVHFASFNRCDGSPGKSAASINYSTDSAVAP